MPNCSESNTVTISCDAYLAGLFDGEGHISSVIGTKSPVPYIKIGLSLTNREVIEAIIAYTGVGTMIWHQRAAHCKQCYQWHVQSREAAAVCLRRMLPYLLIKRERALLALELIELANAQGARQGKKVTMSEITPRWVIHEQIKELNRRGYP
jgi:hypothetical protein